MYLYHQFYSTVSHALGYLHFSHGRDLFLCDISNIYIGGGCVFSCGNGQLIEDITLVCLFLYRWLWFSSAHITVLVLFWWTVSCFREKLSEKLALWTVCTLLVAESAETLRCMPPHRLKYQNIAFAFIGDPPERSPLRYSVSGKRWCLGECGYVTLGLRQQELDSHNLLSHLSKPSFKLYNYINWLSVDVWP